MLYGRITPLRLAFAALVALLLAALPAAAQAPTESPAASEYDARIKPIFESRCVACHSCFGAPCQLNLQSYSGAARGATSRGVYDARRSASVPPTRLDIDATTPEQWRQKGFWDVLGAGDVNESLLLHLTKLRSDKPALQPRIQATDSQVCVVGVKDPRISDGAAQLGMPYGLPPLEKPEVAALQSWIEKGAPGPQADATPWRSRLPAGLRSEIESWEQFLNEPTARQQLVSRYLFEHLFLASLHFASSSPGPASAGAANRPPFFRLVRSRTACSGDIDEIATVRPTDAPGIASFSYCLTPVTGTIVEKKHIPYELSPRKLDRIKQQFLSGDWTVSRGHTYGNDQANNPFATFAPIPVKARYQFLLDDAQYHVETFIKGPVCNGSEAVNSIQEQFFVFFLKPEADSMVMSEAHARAAQSKLVLPGAWGSDVSLLRDLPFMARLVEYREQYRKLRLESIRQLRPNGYALDDIWDGDGVNPNAALTVFRHFDNAAVVRGAVGDLSKTVFVLDYPLFERLVYNLVANFDVYGNLGHQVLTRIYMDMIRMEAEELFLQFLPSSQRERLRRDWYQGGLLTEIKMNYIFPLRGEKRPTAIKFRNDKASKVEFVQRVLFERLPPVARGPSDPINWRVLRAPAGSANAPSPVDQSLRRLASVYAFKPTPFPRYFPDLALLLVKGAQGRSRVYTIVHNREHDNISWIMGESSRLIPYQDTLTIAEGILGSYPNMFFVVDESDVDGFSKAAASLTSSKGYEDLVQRYGVPRTSDRFWAVYDEVNAVALRGHPIERGLLDLTRYELAVQK